MATFKSSVRREKKGFRGLCIVWKICYAKSAPITALPNCLSDNLLIIGAVFKGIEVPSEILCLLNSIPSCKDLIWFQMPIKGALRRIKIGAEFGQNR